MKLLVDKSLLSYATPFVFSGFAAAQHNPEIMSTFDTFDSYEPDIYLADADLLNNTTYKAMEERPALRVVVIQNGLGDHSNKKEFENRFGNLYSWVNDTGHADLYSYSKAQFVQDYKADLVCIEDKISAFLVDLNIPSSIIFRIFSNQVIHSKNYCGALIGSININKDIYKSSKFSIATGNNIYNSILCDCYAIEPQNFIIDILYQNKDNELKQLKEEILNTRTNFHAVSSILNNLGYNKESAKVMEKMKELL